VKTSQYFAKFWPMPSLEKVRSGPNDFYILVRRTGDAFEAFMLRGREAKEELQAQRNWFEKKCATGKKGKEFPCVYVERTGHKAKRAQWADRWRSWNINPPHGHV